MHREGAPLAFPGLDADLAAVSLDQPFHDGEAEPGAAAAVVRLLVRIEDASDFTRGNADARIADRELDLRASIGEPDLNRRAFRGELHGIAQEVHHHAQETVLIALDAEVRAIRGAAHREALLLDLRSQLLDAVHRHLFHVDQTPFERHRARAQARKLEDLAHQAEKTVRAGGDDAHESGLLGRERARYSFQ